MTADDVRVFLKQVAQTSAPLRSPRCAGLGAFEVCGSLVFSTQPNDWRYLGLFLEQVFEGLTYVCSLRRGG